MGVDGRPDAEILAAAIGGDGRAFAALWDRHRDRVFGSALRQTALRVEAEDATAIVFLEAWRKRASLRIVDGSLLPWLLVTTTNVCRNLRRASRRYRAVLETVAAGPAPAEPTGADLDLRRAIAALPAGDQRLIGLTLDGFSPTEAAAVLGLTPGAARTRLSRIRARLRERLRPVPDEPGGLTPTRGL